ncbi:MAG: phage recombination protein Bet [Archaeoglobaceae archaeon]
MSEIRPFTEPEMALLKSTIVPASATEDEIKLFVLLCKKYNLDPFTKEIVMVKYQARDGFRTSFITTRDGYLKIAMQDENFDGIMSAVVREGDEFEIDAAKLEVRHKFGIKRGPIIGAWAVARHKKRPPVIVFVDFNEYKQNTPVWNQYPSAMIQKVAEVAALRRQFNISGLVAQEEINEEIENAEFYSEPRQIEPPNDKVTEKQLKAIYKLIDQVAKATESPKEEIISEIKQKYGVEHSKDLTKQQASRIIEELQTTLSNIGQGV